MLVCCRCAASSREGVFGASGAVEIDQRIAELRADLRTEFATGLTSLEARLRRRLIGVWIA